MRIESVQEIATRAEQLLRLTVDREFNIHDEDGRGFVPTVTVEEQGPGQFVATARLTLDDKSIVGSTVPGLTLRSIGFTRYEALGALVNAIIQHLGKWTESHRKTAASCRDFSARMRLAAASRRARLDTVSRALRCNDQVKALAGMAANLGYEDIEIGAHRVAGDGAWKAVAQGRSIYCEAISDTSLDDAMLALASRIVAESMRECERCETNAMRSDHKAMAYGLLADHFAAEAADIDLSIREATRR